MAVALNAEDIGDLLTSTHDDWIKMSWTDISMPLQSYKFASAFMRGRQNIMAGPRLIWDIQHKNTGSARVTGLYDTDNVHVDQLLTQARVEWSAVNASYTFDKNEEAFNSGKGQILNYLKVRIHSMYNDFFTLMEELMWANPSPTAQPNEPLGIRHWVVQGSADAFNNGGGGNPSGFSNGAGNVSSTTYPAWANGTARYTAVNDSDAIAKIWEAFIKTDFQAPDPYSETGGGRPAWGFFTTFPFIESYVQYLKSSNQNVGHDAANFRSAAPLLMGIPLERVPALDVSTSPSYDANNPVYGLNFKKFRWVFRQGMDRMLTKPIRVGNAHNVFQVHLDSFGQFQCTDRRSQWVIHHT